MVLAMAALLPEEVVFVRDGDGGLPSPAVLAMAALLRQLLCQFKLRSYPMTMAASLPQLLLLCQFRLLRFQLRSLRAPFTTRFYPGTSPTASQSTS